MLLISLYLLHVYTKFGDFSIGSPLSYQLSVITNVITNIKDTTKSVNNNNNVYDHKKLPLGFIPLNHESIYQRSGEN